mmetsp:Transcript_56237/g.83607  ORF Transcript_56237/g.83607 Transcript_56237/m.83607 type:complete len:100 (-) Transcript_56237:73-372(-)
MIFFCPKVGRDDNYDGGFGGFNSGGGTGGGAGIWEDDNDDDNSGVGGGGGKYSLEKVWEFFFGNRLMMVVKRIITLFIGRNFVSSHRYGACSPYLFFRA